MKRLFDENSKYTPEAIELNDQARTLIKELVEEYSNAGYCLRDIQNVLYGSVLDVILLKLI